MKIIDCRQTPSEKIVDETIKTLMAGGLVVFPTETTYGIGADATNQKAIDKLLKYKARREGKPLSIAVVDEQMAEQYVELNATAHDVYTRFLPGPVTVVSKGKHVVAKGVESETGTLGIRIPDYQMVLQIVKAFGKPITATGANASYKKRPYTTQDIFDSISEKQKQLIDLVLDVGELPHNEPSTVIDTTLDDIAVLRQGEISFTESTEVVTHSEEETIELGKRLTAKYKNTLSYKAIVFCLVGEMGVGKTQFSKGIAQALGITQRISSPTYVLSRNYSFEAEGKKLEFMHIDTWRMFDSNEFVELGFQHMIDNCSVVSIEWADRVFDVLKRYTDEAKCIWVKFSYGKDDDDRVITYSDKPFA